MGSSFCFSLAFVCFAAAHARAAVTAEAAFQRAASALQSQNYAEAESGFREVLKLEPGNIGALGNLGVVYSRTHRYAQAIGVYKEALKIAPRDSGMLTNLGLAYIKQEQFAPAVPIFQQLAADPSNLQARELLASCWISLEKYESALAVLQPLAAEESQNPGVFYMEGIAFIRLKKADESKAAFDRMMKVAQPSQANFLMGQASYETGDFEQAATFFKQTIADDPHFAGAHRELGKTLISLRNNEEAEKQLRLEDPDDGEAAYFLGALLWRTKPVEALALLNRARNDTPDFWGPLYYLGRLNIEEGRLDEGIAQLKQAARLKPDSSTIYYQLALAYKRKGQAAEAKAALARVKELGGQSLQKEIDVISH